MQIISQRYEFFLKYEIFHFMKGPKNSNKNIKKLKHARQSAWNGGSLRAKSSRY